MFPVDSLPIHRKLYSGHQIIRAFNPATLQNPMTNKLLHISQNISVYLRYVG
jgi:hypothetical protein